MEHKVKYNTSIISFLDILGFGSIVDSTHSADEVFKILETFKYQAQPNKELAKEYELKFTNFSDTVIRTTPIFSETNKEFRSGILFHELLDLIHIQSELICDGIFIRGGVTIGKICQEGRHVFGPGLNKAYYLENEEASYPRIIVDRSVFDDWKNIPLLRSQFNDLPTEKQFIKSLVRECNDTILFLDYLNVMSVECDSIYGYVQFLARHKQLIEENSKNFEDNASIVEKYKRLSEYHNEVIASLPEEVRGNLQITNYKD